MEFYTCLKSENRADILSFSELFKLGPQLERIKIRDGGHELERSFDADFCGIHEEEANYLRDKENEFLEAAHIVPIK